MGAPAPTEFEGGWAGPPKGSNTAAAQPRPLFGLGRYACWLAIEAPAAIRTVEQWLRQLGSDAHPPTL